MPLKKPKGNVHHLKAVLGHNKLRVLHSWDTNEPLHSLYVTTTTVLFQSGVDEWIVQDTKAPVVLKKDCWQTKNKSYIIDY